tara:strand:+ start:256 stop:600 length:345 start_codon:yes stop_codon:yes gene_type:complete
MRKKLFSGGLLKTGSVIREAVKIPEFKSLKKRINKFIDKRYKGKNRDEILKKQEFKVRKGEALEEAMAKFVKEKGFSKKDIESGKKALKALREYNEKTKLSAREYIKSKGKPKN